MGGGGGGWVACEILLSSPGTGGSFDFSILDFRFYSQVPGPRSQVPVPVAWQQSYWRHPSVTLIDTEVVTQVRYVDFVFHQLILWETVFQVSGPK